MSRSTTADQVSDLLVPALWIAGVAFSTGFLGYLAFGLNAIAR